MEPLVRPSKGARFLGISNFSPSQVDQLVAAAKIKPVVHQFETHPYLPQSDFVASHASKGIAVTAYAPLGNTNAAYGDLAKKAPPLLSHAVITEISAARGCKPAAVVLSWNLKRGVGVIPKAANLEHAKENLKGLDGCKLTDEDMSKITGIGKQTNLRVNVGGCKMMGFVCFEGLDGGPYA
jgi:alcohol dehydrogenase (NADP+)